MGTKKGEKQGNQKRKRLIILACIIIIVVVIIVIVKSNVSKEEQVDEGEEETLSYVEEIEAGVKLNTAAGINEIRTVDGFEFSNIQLTSTGGMTSFLADVKNVSGETTELKSVQVILYDEDGNTLATLPGVISALEADETTQFNVGSTANFVNAYDLEIVVE